MRSSPTFNYSLFNNSRDFKPSLPAVSLFSLSFLTPITHSKVRSKIQQNRFDVEDLDDKSLSHLKLPVLQVCQRDPNRQCLVLGQDLLFPQCIYSPASKAVKMTNDDD